MSNDTVNTTSTTNDAAQRRVARVVGTGQHHLVGDGFRVESLFSPGDALARLVDPFLLLDYHAPYEYPPAAHPRGVGVHPHRGFETVTLAFDGSVAHHDSTGAGGVIRAGDVQWMTAASGILHKEYHEADWARTGGRFQMVQLWVNLPAANKMDPPRYQPLTADEMGQVELPDGAGSVRVVAGEFAGVRGPATTFTPVELWDVTLSPGRSLAAPIPPGHNVVVLALDGELAVNGETVASSRLAVLDRSEPGRDGVTINAEAGGRALVMAGEPIGEPLAAHGPFVMNTREELIEAFEDFQAGRFGHLDD